MRRSVLNLAALLKKTEPESRKTHDSVSLPNGILSRFTLLVARPMPHFPVIMCLLNDDKC